MLRAEADGRLADELLAQTDAAVAAFLMRRLRVIFGEATPEPGSVTIGRWPRGVPFLPLGAEHASQVAMKLACRPLGRVFFAGSYCSRFLGVASGAVLAGMAAAHGALCELGGRAQLAYVAPMLRPACAPTCRDALWAVLEDCGDLGEDDPWRTSFLPRGRALFPSAGAGGALPHREQGTTDGSGSLV